MQTALIADPCNGVRELLQVTFRLIGWRTVEARDGDEALAIVRAERPDVVLLEIALPIQGGWKVLRKIRDNVFLRQLPVILMTGWPRLKLDDGVGELHPWRILQKPFRPIALMRDILIQTHLDFCSNGDRESDPMTIVGDWIFVANAK